MIASMIRKMHVPAKPPVDVGVHAEEKRGVECALVKTIDMPMLPEEVSEEPMSIESIVCVESGGSSVMSVCGWLWYSQLFVLSPSVFWRRVCTAQRW